VPEIEGEEMSLLDDMEAMNNLAKKIIPIKSQCVWQEDISMPPYFDGTLEVWDDNDELKVYLLSKNETNLDNPYKADVTDVIDLESIIGMLEG
jgi:hypothetical protein